MPTSFTLRSSVTSSYSLRDDVSTSLSLRTIPGENCMDVIITGYWDDAQPWQDSKIWWDAGSNGISWTVRNPI